MLTSYQDSTPGTRGVSQSRAFPEGIPTEILNDGYDHRTPLYAESTTFLLADHASPSDLERWEQAVLEIKKSKMIRALQLLDES